jgi:hypothetical protein
VHTSYGVCVEVEVVDLRIVRRLASYVHAVIQHVFAHNSSDPKVSTHN